MNLDFQVNNKLNTYFYLFPCDTQVERKKEKKKNSPPCQMYENIKTYE